MKSMKNILFLLTADIIWGAAFVAQRTGGDAVGAYSFNCIRFLIGALVLLPVIAIFGQKKKAGAAERRMLLIGGIVCGVALAIASNLQQVGITLGSSVGKAGFLTACYIIIVPILGLFMHKKCGWNVGIGVLLALGGLYFLCMQSGSFSLEKSDILLLLCALAFAIQILAIDHYAPLVDPIRLSCIEFLVCGLVSAIPMFWVDMQHSVAGTLVWAQSFTSSGAWIAILYAGICSSGIGYTCQIMGQRNFNPTVASLIMSLESAFSVLFGWLLLHEQLTSRELIGVLLVFSAIIVAQIPVPHSKSAKTSH